MKIMLEPGAKCPTKGTPGSAGWDLYAHSLEIKDGTYVYGTGVHVQIPAGCVGLLCARSSGFKLDQRMLLGVIDHDYTGEVKCLFDQHKHTGLVLPSCYKLGDRIAQLVVIRLTADNDHLDIVDELDQTERGEGGFGSTGR